MCEIYSGLHMGILCNLLYHLKDLPSLHILQHCIVKHVEFHLVRLSTFFLSTYLSSEYISLSHFCCHKTHKVDPNVDENDSWVHDNIPALQMSPTPLNSLVP